ncbi:amidase family protein [Bradyrhizobium sp. CCBAU 53380]|uniref:amidase family protein n=1 Tax=Bradyrhizobium sp. CCBAU 53380 TaxID=1325117 RepID=UPI002FDF9F94
MPTLKKCGKNMQYSTTCALTSVKVQFHEWNSKRGIKGVFYDRHLGGTAFGTPMKPQGISRLPLNGQGLPQSGNPPRGSIRIPAALSGVVGFKPTSGFVPTTDAFSL